MKLKDVLENYENWEIENFEMFKASLKKPFPTSPWDLKDNDKYYVITDDSEIIEDYWDSHSIVDFQRREQGNVFLTQEEAIEEIKRRHIVTLLKKYSRGYKFTPNQNNFSFSYDTQYKYLDSVISTINADGEIYFKTLEDIRKAINEIGEENIIKYYLQIEEE